MDSFWNTGVSTNASNTAAPMTAADLPAMLAQMRGITDRAAEDDRQQADVLRALALKHGFDLDAGDLMIAPQSFDLHIPLALKDRVRVSSLATSIMFINRTYVVDPLIAPPSLFPRR
ncbi:hypothetical protein Bcep1808_7764 (plasmid) [Burkholderia vietnamiensis G4]|uniref:Uncharacterized protein n=1 Tax=Burkholderia vietnamiensis (strain G4 / LMG 22486) TaxID=269482 RepID=A4JWI1_BURVG|nr:hypothetical protein Bcep1808_7764 [Burkholderia vietnamiensis G4]